MRFDVPERDSSENSLPVKSNIAGSASQSWKCEKEVTVWNLRAVPTAKFQMLVVALVHSRLDYSNAVLVGIPAMVRCLQLVLNEAARLICHLRPHDDALATLHWLRVPERMHYKIAAVRFCSVCTKILLVSGEVEFIRIFEGDHPQRGC